MHEEKTHETAVATNTHPVPGIPTTRRTSRLTTNTSLTVETCTEVRKYSPTMTTKKTDGAGGSGNATEPRRTLRLMVYEDTVEVSLVHSVVILYTRILLEDIFTNNPSNNREGAGGCSHEWEPHSSSLANAATEKKTVWQATRVQLFIDL